MTIVLEIGTQNYSDDRFSIKRAMSHMESLVSGYNGYVLSEPSSKFGWTFFKMAIKPNLQNGIEEKFSDMIARYNEGDPSQKFAHFMNDYFNSKGCKVKVKITD